MRSIAKTVAIASTSTWHFHLDHSRVLANNIFEPTKSTREPALSSPSFREEYLPYALKICSKQPLLAHPSQGQVMRFYRTAP